MRPPRRTSRIASLPDIFSPVVPARLSSSDLFRQLEPDPQHAVGPVARNDRHGRNLARVAYVFSDAGTAVERTDMDDPDFGRPFGQPRQVVTLPRLIDRNDFGTHVRARGDLFVDRPLDSFQFVGRQAAFAAKVAFRLLPLLLLVMDARLGLFHRIASF